VGWLCSLSSPHGSVEPAVVAVPGLVHGRQLHGHQLGMQTWAAQLDMVGKRPPALTYVAAAATPVAAAACRACRA
jgi:hypothetical protein